MDAMLNQSELAYWLPSEPESSAWLPGDFWEERVCARREDRTRALRPAEEGHVIRAGMSLGRVWQVNAWPASCENSRGGRI
jgi:hypothetical protein